MTETLLNQGGEDPLQDVKALVANWMKCLSDMQQALVENEQLRQRVAALESANAQKDVEIKNLSVTGDSPLSPRDLPIFCWWSLPLYHLMWWFGS